MLETEGREGDTGRHSVARGGESVGWDGGAHLFPLLS